MDKIQGILDVESDQIQESAFSRIGKSIQSQYRGFGQRTRRPQIALRCSLNRLAQDQSFSPWSQEERRTDVTAGYSKRRGSQQLSSSFAAVNRERSNVSVVANTKEKMPSAGQYYPGYSLVEEKVKVFKFTYTKPQRPRPAPGAHIPNCSGHHHCFQLAKRNRRKERTQSVCASSPISRLQSRRGSNSPAKPPVCTPVSGHLKSAIQFRLQLGRDETAGGVVDNGSNERRFEYHELPARYLGAYSEPRAPNFDKMKPRDNILLLRQLNLHDYDCGEPTHLDSLTSGMIELRKMQPRDEASPQKPFQVPEFYPQDKIDSGFTRLGHVRRVSSPTMENMSPRDNKLYYINEFQNLDGPKEEALAKQFLDTCVSKHERDGRRSLIKMHKMGANN